MWAAFKVLRLFARSLVRIAVALEELRDLYRLDLASRGIVRVYANIMDPVEVSYGHTEDRE